MSVADEITKLLELKNRGAITESEFEAEKAKILVGASTKTHLPNWTSFIAPAILVAASVAGYFVWQYEAPPRSCSAENTRTQLTTMFDNSSYAQKLQVRATSVDSLERNLAISDADLACIGHLTASNGTTYRIEVQWTMDKVAARWIPQ